MSDNIELNAIEDLLEDLSKSLTSQEDERVSSVEILAKGTDAIINQNQDLIEMIQKSLQDFNEKLDALNERLEQVEQLEEKVEKGFTSLASEPIQKSVLSAEAVPSPAEVVEVKEMTKAEVLSKALNELRDTNDSMRVVELRRAVSRLESNFAPSQVASELGYNQ